MFFFLRFKYICIVLDKIQYGKLLGMLVGEKIHRERNMRKESQSPEAETLWGGKKQERTKSKRKTNNNKLNDNETTINFTTHYANKHNE
jgi:hypothetical protein